jgi:hypothetical protein
MQALEAQPNAHHDNLAPTSSERSLGAEDPPWLPCPFCAQPLVEETDGTHCGGCAVTWWEGLR